MKTDNNKINFSKKLSLKTKRKIKRIKTVHRYNTEKNDYLKIFMIEIITCFFFMLHIFAKKME